MGNAAPPLQVCPDRLIIPLCYNQCVLNRSKKCLDSYGPKTSQQLIWAGPHNVVPRGLSGQISIRLNETGPNQDTHQQKPTPNPTSLRVNHTNRCHPPRGAVGQGAAKRRLHQKKLTSTHTQANERHVLGLTHSFCMSSFRWSKRGVFRIEMEKTDFVFHFGHSALPFQSTRSKGVKGLVHVIKQCELGKAQGDRRSITICFSQVQPKR